MSLHRLRRLRIPEDMQFTDYKDLLARGKVADAVFVCVLVSSLIVSVNVILIISLQDQLHAPLVTEFAKQGYHIFCEKPMATSIAECVQMVKEVQAEDKKVFGIGHGQSFAITTLQSS